MSKQAHVKGLQGPPDTKEGLQDYSILPWLWAIVLWGNPHIPKGQNEGFVVGEARFA